MIANSIPQTATVPRTNGPEVHAELRRSAAVRPDARARRSRMSRTRRCRSSRSATSSYYAVTAGVWFSVDAADGAVDHRDVGARGRSTTIPPSSPIYYVTYVRIYEATPQVRLRRLHARLPRHRRRACTARSSTAPATRTRRGSAASGIRRPTRTASPRRRSTTPTSDSRSASRWASRPPRGRSRTGAARTTIPLTTAAIRAARRRAPTSTGIGATTAYSGTRSWYAGGGVAGTTASGNYYNQRTGTSGSYNAGRQYNALDRQRHARLRPHDQRRGRRLGQRRARAATTTPTRASARPAHAASGTTAGGSTYNRAGATTAGPRRRRARRRRLDVQREDRADQQLGARRRSATITTPTSTATSIKNTGRRLAAALVERLGQRRRRQLVGEQRITKRARTAIPAMGPAPVPGASARFDRSSGGGGFGGGGFGGSRSRGGGFGGGGELSADSTGGGSWGWRRRLPAGGFRGGGRALGSARVSTRADRERQPHEQRHRSRACLVAARHIWSIRSPGSSRRCRAALSAAKLPSSRSFGIEDLGRRPSFARCSRPDAGRLRGRPAAAAVAREASGSAPDMEIRAPDASSRSPRRR